jgi:hypothetical protein
MNEIMNKLKGVKSKKKKVELLSLNAALDANNLLNSK